MIERVEPELQPRGDAEVAAAAAEPPEELLVSVGAGVDDGSVRRDDLRSHEVVAGQAVLGRQVADPAAEREARDPGRADDAARSDEAEGLRGGVEVEPRRTTLGPGDACAGVHLHRPHLRQVDHEPAVEDAMAGRVVSAAAHGHLEILLAGEPEAGCDVLGAEATGDDRRPAVDERIEPAAGRVVAVVTGDDHGPGE